MQRYFCSLFLLVTLILVVPVLSGNIFAQTGTDNSKLTNNVVRTLTVSETDGTAGVLVDRLRAAQSRLEKIGAKMSSRIAKLQAKGVRVTNLNSSYLKLDSQISQSKVEINKLNPGDPVSFKQNAMSMKSILAEILAGEKKLINEMALSEPKTASPSVTGVKK